MTTSFSLQQLGWRNFFSQQLTLEDLGAHRPARIAAIHRTGPVVLGEQGELILPFQAGLEVAVGDWVLLAPDAPRIERVLQRQTLLARIAAGTEPVQQAIAANLDSLFITTACEQEFNLSRLERYLALALEAGVLPVVVLTKADLCDDASELLEEAQRIAVNVECVALDARSPACLPRLQPWLGAGQTVALVGSSGVGKSTLINALLGGDAQATAVIRANDGEGRHTTTTRQLLAMPGGAWLIDTPGMRELNIGAAAAGMRAAFEDVEAFAASCRFRDCKHLGDAGCAVEAAVADGHLEARRFANYLKLQREVAHSMRTQAEKHATERRFGRMVKRAVQRKRGR